MLRLTLIASAALVLESLGTSRTQDPQPPSQLVQLLPQARWIQSGATVWSAVWSENGVPHYAISLDGQKLATVRETSYALLQRRATFDPLEGGPSLADSPFGTNVGNVYFVQFWTQPLETYTAALAALSAQVYDYVPEHAHLVRMDPKTAELAAALPFVRYVGPFHPEFRLEPFLLAGLRDGTLPAAGTYNVQSFETGLAQKLAIAAKVRALGGTVETLSPHGRLMRATLSPEALLVIASSDEVSFIDRWGPPEPDMDIVRQISGANFLQTATGFQGQGVRGEVMDTGCLTTHVDFQHDGGVTVHTGNVQGSSHGTQVYGIVFGNGTGQAAGKGLLPMGSGMIAAYTSVGDRFAHTLELVNASLPYKAVFQTNSWGSPQVTNYTTESAQMDDIILAADLLITQSQSNTGSQLSRPQAWAKNIVSVGGIVHNDTLTKADDLWSGASIGPAEDGRLKPDLSHFYDSVWAPSSSCNTCYGNFSGTSSATPCTVGHFGLFFQMWHNAVFNNPTGATVFDSAPRFTLAKAALINTASSYPFSGLNHNLTRTHQGWGLADVSILYNKRFKTFWVNETAVVNNLATVSYPLTVGAGETELKVTMVYREQGGAVSPTQHRKNDLSLRVTAPGGTIYWGNNGLSAGNWSTSGGTSNTKDTVENVFVQNPAAGTWTVDVIGSDVNTDMRPEPGNNADFALWVTGVTLGGCSAPTSYCTAKLSTSGCLPAIGSSGQPALSNPAGFSITTTAMEAGQNSLSFFGLAGPASTPFQGGTLCVAGILNRLNVKNSGGAAACSGSISYTLAELLASPGGGGIGLGQQVNCQTWGRDVPDPFGSSLSNGLQFVTCP